MPSYHNYNGEDTRMYTPDLLTMTDGTPVTSSAQWEARRGELLNILAREQYGTFLPPSTASAQVMAPPNARLRRTRHAGDARCPL